MGFLQVGINYRGFSDGSGDRWTGDNGLYPAELDDEYYNASPQWWAMDLRDFARQHSDYYMDAFQFNVWAKRKKHNGDMYIKCADFFRGSWADYPSDNDYWSLNNAGSLGNIAQIDAGRKHAEYEDGTIYLNRPILLSTLINSPLYLSLTGRYPARRKLGKMFIVGISAYRERPGFPGWTGDVMRRNGRNTPGWTNSLNGYGHWNTEFRGGRDYLA